MAAWSPDGGDEPGPRTEEDATARVVRGDGGAEPFECVPGHGGVQVSEEVVGVPEAEHCVVGGGGVRAVEDRLVDVGEVDLGEAGGRQDARGDRRVGEGERVGSFVVEAGAAVPTVRASRIAVAHSLRSWSCQTNSTRRAPERSARPMLVNAATGSAKNIVPNRLMHKSKCVDGKGWVWASA